MIDVRFIQISRHCGIYALNHFEVIAWNSDHSFHKGLCDIARITEHDDVAVFGLFIRQNVLADGARRGIGELIDQQVVAHQQRVFHGTSGDDKGLDQRGGAEKAAEEIVTVHSAIVLRTGSVFLSGCFRQPLSQLASHQELFSRPFHSFVTSVTSLMTRFDTALSNETFASNAYE